MRSRTLSLAIALPLALLAGCGSSSSSSSSSTAGSGSGDKTAFCNDNAKIDQATASVKDATAALKALKGQQATIDDFAKNTPSAIKSSADELVNGTKSAESANSGAVFADPKFQAAGTAVNSYCGQNPDGSPASGGGTTT